MVSRAGRGGGGARVLLVSALYSATWRGGGVRVLRLRRHAGVLRRSALLQGWEAWAEVTAQQLVVQGRECLAGPGF